jgi:hypothetical protein
MAVGMLLQGRWFSVFAAAIFMPQWHVRKMQPMNIQTSLEVGKTRVGRWWPNGSWEGLNLKK